MARRGLWKDVRRRLYAFAGRVARSVGDSRRKRFLQEMIEGLVVAGYVHLAKFARALGWGPTACVDIDVKPGESPNAIWMLIPWVTFRRLAALVSWTCRDYWGPRSGAGGLRIDAR